MKILGLCWDIASSASVSIDDKIVYAASEERFSRRKSDEQYPYNAIENGLDFCAISPNDLDQIVIGSTEMAFKYFMLNKTSTFSVNDLIILVVKNFQICWNYSSIRLTIVIIHLIQRN